MKIQNRRLAPGLRGHPIRDAIVDDLGSRTDGHGEPQRELFRPYDEGPEADALFDHPGLGNDAGLARRRAGIRLVVPVQEAGLEVARVGEFAHREERVLDPPDEPLHRRARAFVAPAPAYVDADPEVQDGLREGRMPRSAHALDTGDDR